MFCCSEILKILRGKSPAATATPIGKSASVYKLLAEPLLEFEELELLLELEELLEDDELELLEELELPQFSTTPPLPL